MEAAIGSPSNRTSLAPALIAESLTALFSTAVIPEGTAMTTLGGTNFRLSTFSIKYPQHSLRNFKICYYTVFHWS